MIDEKKKERELEVAEMMVKTKELADQRDDLQQQISNIETVTGERDTYFASLSERITQSEMVSNSADIDVDGHLFQAVVDMTYSVTDLPLSSHCIQQHVFFDFRGIFWMAVHFLSHFDINAYNLTKLTI